jgi:hypothetical protein
MYFWLPDRVDTMRVTRNIALQTKNKFEGLGDIIHRVMGQLPVPIAVEETVPRSRHRQADITSPSRNEAVRRRTATMQNHRKIANHLSVSLGECWEPPPARCA